MRERVDMLAAITTDLLDSNVDLILVEGCAAAAVARQVTQRIPIVMSCWQRPRTRVAAAIRVMIWVSAAALFGCGSLTAFSEPVSRELHP
jgi:hypothetical protein